MKRERGKTTRGTMKVKMPPQPTIRQMMTVPPMTPSGNINPARMKGSFVYIELKSLLSKLMIFPSSPDLAVKAVSRETLAYISRMSPALILQEMMGME